MVKVNEDGIASVASAVPTNSMGASSSAAGSGGINMFDPVMKVKRQDPLKGAKQHIAKSLGQLMKRKSLQALRNEYEV